MLFIQYFKSSFSKKKSPTIETRNELEDIVKDLKSGKVSEILSMPAMTEAKEVTRVPSPKSVLDKDKIYLNYVSKYTITVSRLYSFLFLSIRTWTIHQ